MSDIINVAGVKYQIVSLSNQEMNGNIGLADFNKQLIILNETHSNQTKIIALLHETIHIVSDAYGLDLTEKQVKIGTHALIEFLVHNPDFKNKIKLF